MEKGKEIPKHIAIIMDGNGRWAKSKGHARIFGHRNAITAVRESIEKSAELGVQYLTLYAFSTENWTRPKTEVRALMELLISTINKELPTLQKNNIRLQTIGDTEALPSKTARELSKAISDTQENTGMTLVLALSYSARWEILNATKQIAKDVKSGSISEDSIDETKFSEYLSTAGFPDPELMIRTSGEYRISNFLLWQLAYTELVFIDKYWPDFRKEDLELAIRNFQNRERRFGKTSEQVSA
jgi:undecaprenyl diphosphate synthase